MTIGRGSGSTLQIDDPAVSRRQAHISLSDGVAVLQDAGSTYGTWLDGHRVNDATPLRDGARIRVGDQELLVERRRDESEAGRTMIVGSTDLRAAGGDNPRVRAGLALKRLDASEGAQRWVLREPVSNRFLRMSDADAQLFQLLDGERDLVELVREAEVRGGQDGPARLARMLSELSERGLLAGTEDGEAPAAGRTRRLLAPRAKSWSGAGAFFDRLYERGGRRLFSKPALIAIAALIAIGLVVFPYLVVARYGTPFVVAQKVGLGGLVFLVARFAVVALHETAHALTMASFGRRVAGAGLKLMLIFPYAYVDTSEAWFEPRRHRIAVSAAGPVSDFSLELCSPSAAWCCRAASCGTSCSSWRSRPTSAVASTSTRSSTATATRSSWTSCASRTCAGGRASSWPGA